MTDSLQLELNLEREQNPHPYIQVSPEGYKGLSGFHKYWGKKPTEAWKFLIEHITEPKSIVLDPFLGSGLIAKECIDMNRRFIGFDINPISIELSKLYLNPPSYLDMKNAVAALEHKIKDQINTMYLLSNGSIATHFLWKNKKITKIWTKNGRKRTELDLEQEELLHFENVEKYIPQNFRDMQFFDNPRINSKKNLSIADLFTPRALKAIDLIKGEIQLFDSDVKRALLLILSSSLGQMSKMVFAVSKRGKMKGQTIDKIEVGSWVIGYWRPEQHFEINAWNCFENKARKLLKAIHKLGLQKRSILAQNLSDFLQSDADVHINVGDSESLLKKIPRNSIKVIITDPPHGDRIPYLELSEMWNSVIDLDSDYANELVISNAKGRHKTIEKYNEKLESILLECSRVLENNGLLAVMFNARSESHWSSLHKLEHSASLNYIGCYPMEYSAGSVVQDTRQGGMKTDFVLLYGKNTSDEFLTYIIRVFSIIGEWSSTYPRKLT